MRQVRSGLRVWLFVPGSWRCHEEHLHVLVCPELSQHWGPSLTSPWLKGSGGRLTPLRDHLILEHLPGTLSFLILPLQVHQSDTSSPGLGHRLFRGPAHP